MNPLDLQRYFDEQNAQLLRRSAIASEPTQYWVIDRRLPDTGLWIVRNASGQERVGELTSTGAVAIGQQVRAIPRTDGTMLLTWRDAPEAIAPPEPSPVKWCTVWFKAIDQLILRPGAGIEYYDVYYAESGKNPILIDNIDGYIGFAPQELGSDPEAFSYFNAELHIVSKTQSIVELWGIRIRVGTATAYLTTSRYLITNGVTASLISSETIETTAPAYFTDTGNPNYGQYFLNTLYRSAPDDQTFQLDDSLLKEFQPRIYFRQATVLQPGLSGAVLPQPPDENSSFIYPRQETHTIIGDRIYQYVFEFYDPISEAITERTGSIRLSTGSHTEPLITFSDGLTPGIRMVTNGIPARVEIWQVRDVIPITVIPSGFDFRDLQGYAILVGSFTFLPQQSEAWLNNSLTLEDDSIIQYWAPHRFKVAVFP